MPVDLRVKGREQLRDAAKRLKAEGEAGKGLRRELAKQIRKEANPLVVATRAAIMAMPNTPPEDSGLRRRIAKQIKVRIRMTGKRAGVRISVGKLDGTNLPRRINKGSWKHPVHGNREVWVEQQGKKGWFDDTLRRLSPKASRGVRLAIDRTLRRIAKG